MHCVKLPGQRLIARDFDRQVAEFQARAAVLNGFTALGIPVTTAAGQVRPGKGELRQSGDLCNRALSVFKRSRDFSAWLGLVPRQHSTGSKQVLGGISEMGQRDIRRLLIIGAMLDIR